MTKPGLGLAVRWIVWGAILFAFWLLLAGEWSQVEILAGASVALVGATAAVVVRRLPGARTHVPLRWVRAAWSVPIAVVADFAIVTWLLVRAIVHGRRVHGSFRVKPFPKTGVDATGRGIRAWVTVAATVSPNAYVIHIDDEEGELLLHELVTWPFSESPA